MKTWIIYKHTLLIGEHAGWSYIGQTSRVKPNQRWRNGNGYKNSYLFYNAIQKSGWDNFSHEIIEDNIQNLEKANERERYWINFYHSWKYDKQCAGYNLTPGGDASEGARLMSNDTETVKIAPEDFETYLALGYMFHDSIEYRPIKQRKWYDEHKAEQNERTKNYYAEHHDERAEINKANCKKYWEDPEFRAHKKQYRKDHPEIETKIRKNYYNKHHNDPEYKRKHAEANRRWAEKKKKEGSK